MRKETKRVAIANIVDIIPKIPKKKHQNVKRGSFVNNFCANVSSQHVLWRFTQFGVEDVANKVPIHSNGTGDTSVVLQDAVVYATFELPQEATVYNTVQGWAVIQKQTPSVTIDAPRYEGEGNELISEKENECFV